MRKAWGTTWLVLGALMPACTLITGSLDDYSEGSKLAGDASDRDVARDDAAMAGDAADAADAVTTPSYRETVLEDQPIAYFRLGETAASSTIRDEINGLTGEIAGLVTRGEPGALAGDPDPAMTFDENASVLVAGDTMDFPGLAAFSIECWIKPSIIDFNYRRIVTNEGTNGAGRQGWLIWIVDRDNGGIGFERYVNGTADGVVSRSAPSSDRWTHAVGTYDGKVVSLFVDGALVDTAGSSRSLVGQSVLKIGAGVASGIAGGLDEVAIYGHALPKDRVMLHYLRGTAGR